MNAAKAGSLATMVGALVLFGSWIFQQTLLDRANGELDRIYQAQGSFQTYESNNAIFNAVLDATSPRKSNVTEIRRVQAYNYELGLTGMQQLLSAKERRGIPPSTSPYSGSDVSRVLRTLQTRLEKIQGAVEAKRESVVAEKDRLGWIFFVLYAAGTALAVSGTVLNSFGRGRVSGVEAVMPNGGGAQVTDP
jgi:hypothetical protein